MVLMHSYGGLPGSAALKGLGKAERGNASAVVRLIYACSFVLGEGESMPGARNVDGLKGMAGDGFDEVVSKLHAILFLARFCA